MKDLNLIYDRIFNILRYSTVQYECSPRIYLSGVVAHAIIDDDDDDDNDDNDENEKAEHSIDEDNDDDDDDTIVSFIS